MILPKLRGDFYEPSFVYFKDFPIIDANIEKKNEIISHVSRILKKNQNIELSTISIESEIDRCVYDIYDLAGEEIRIVEGSNYIH